MAFRRSLIACVVALVAVSSACSSGKSTPKSAGSTTTTLTTKTTTQAATQPGVAVGASKWTNSTIHPVTSVVAAGGRFLVYGATGGKLTLYGLDPATGNVAWQQAATRSDAAQGITLLVTMVGDAVVYLRPGATPDDGDQLVAADPATGKDRWVSPAAAFDSLPDDCGDGAHVCAGVETVGIYAFALRDGARQKLDVPADAREIGPALYDFGGRSPETFGVALPSGRLWSATVNDVFGPNHSTDYGWDFEKYKSDGVYAASVAPTEPDNASTTSEDLTKSSTVGLDATNGKKLWSVPASYLACQAALFVSTNPGSQGPPLPVLCSYAGTANFDKAGNVTLSGPTTVSGFDPKTGAIRWQWKANNDTSLLDATKSHVQVDDESVVLPNDKGALFVVNLRTGKAVAVTPGVAGWCVTTAIYTFGPDDPKNPGDNEAAGGNVAHPCTADGKDGGTPARLPHGIGATVGAVVAYATATGVTALAVK